MLRISRLMLFILALQTSMAFGRALTIFDPIGNQLLASRFAQYSQKAPICQIQNQNRRVIVTGYGPFMGSSENISERVVQTLSGQLRPIHALDAYGKVQTEIAAGQSIDVCYLSFDVLWDIAGAILATEMKSFQPEIVIMSGVGGFQASFETGALNQAAAFGGFDFNGQSISHTTPIDNYVLPRQDLGVQNIIAMTWDSQKTSTAAAPLIAALGFGSKIEAPGRESNDYLCNNISYLALHAAEGVKLRLAGGLIELQNPSFNTKIGFFHYPSGATTDATSLQSWANIVRSMIVANL